MGALEAPQDRHGQDHRTGTSRVEQMTEAMAELGAPEAMAGARRSGGHGGAGSSGGHGRWSFMATPAGTLLPPKEKFSLGKLEGIRSPPGLDRQDRTALWGQTDRTRHPSRAKQTGTGQPTGTGSPPGLSSEAEASSGHGIRGPHRVPQQPLPLP